MTAMKKIYNTPELERICIDNEISLILASTALPGDPNAGDYSGW